MQESSLSGFHTLVLNADFRPLSYFPLSTCCWQDAIKALVLDRVFVVAEYEQKVHSPSVSFHIPSIIAVKNYVSERHQTPSLSRHNILLRDKYTCQYCGDHFHSRELTLDHVVPKSLGGGSGWDNLVAACRACNTMKGDKMPGRGFRAPMHAPTQPSTRHLQEHAQQTASYRMQPDWEEYL